MSSGNRSTLTINWRSYHHVIEYTQENRYQLFVLRDFAGIGSVPQYKDALSKAESSSTIAQPDSFMWGISIFLPEYLRHCDDEYGNCEKEDDCEIIKLKEAIDRTKDLGGKWTKYDQILEYAEQRGIQIIFVLGTGFKTFLPMIDTISGQTQITVDDFTDTYRSCLALHVNAVVRKYKDRVHIWQIENELNVAEMANIHPRDWRHGPSNGGLKWVDPFFKTSLIDFMNKAIKSEDSTAKIYTNFHLLNLTLSPPYINYINWWKGYLDIIGLNIYRGPIKT